MLECSLIQGNGLVCSLRTILVWDPPSMQYHDMLSVAESMKEFKVLLGGTTAGHMSSTLQRLENAVQTVETTCNIPMGYVFPGKLYSFQCYTAIRKL